MRAQRSSFCSSFVLFHPYSSKFKFGRVGSLVRRRGPLINAECRRRRQLVGERGRGGSRGGEMRPWEEERELGEGCAAKIGSFALLLPFIAFPPPNPVPHCWASRHSPLPPWS